MRFESRTIVNNYYTEEDIMLFKRFAKVINNDYGCEYVINKEESLKM